MTDDEHTAPDRLAHCDRPCGLAEIVVLLRRRPARAADDTVDVVRGEQLLGLLRERSRRGRTTDRDG